MMKLSAIYEKEIVRTINPAIAAQDLSDESVKIEIEEYVFTDEIINSLYRTLLAIKNRINVSKTGIWINGYYGSGKSHFLKYLHYCVNRKTQDKAFSRLVEAVKKRDPFLHPESKSQVSNHEIDELRRWLENAEIEDILFNAQDVAKAKKDENTLTYIFFNMFNRCRGYNAYNIPLAVLFEKYLDEKGRLDEFKARLQEEANFDWDKQAAEVVRLELDTILAVAKKCVPTLDVESLKSTLLNPQTYHIDTAKFSREVKEYLRSKDPNYRLIFLVDEVSQFIGDNQALLLDLQTIVERISMDCNRQVWIACTAQQTVDEVMTATGITSTSDSYGKIMGRFETRVSLESTDPAYITQERILEKNSEGLTALKKLYNSKKEAIHNQFAPAHELCNGFKDEEEFTRSYPFIPYQFKLISQVFDAFQQKEFVVKEVKDNERSILKITHETAKRTMNWEVDSFIPFDEFYNNMFQQNLIHKGTKAFSPTLQFVRNDEFAARVAKALFMISNLKETDQLNFKPTLENLTLLLMTQVDENKMLLRDKIEKVLQALIGQNLIREENGKYFFYNEDESDLSTMIKNSAVGLEAKADIIRDLLFPYINVETKYRYMGNDFKIAAKIDGRHYFSSPNTDVQVSFLVYDSAKAEELALTNNTDTLLVCLSELFSENKRLRGDFDWYCRVEDYLFKNMNAATGVRRNTLELFRQRNRDLFERRIKPAFQNMFDKTRFVSGPTVIEPTELSGKGRERYRRALDKHFARLYKHAALVNGLPATADELRAKANEPYNMADYGNLKPMTDAEKMVNEYVTRMGDEILLTDLVANFSKVPYGWRDITVIYLVTELVKRRLREIKYKHQLRFPVKEFAVKAINTSERASLSIMKAQEIPQELINEAVAAWGKVFNEYIPTSSDSNRLFEELSAKLKSQTEHWQRVKSDHESYPFSRPVAHLTDKLNAWLQIRDPKRFYETLIGEKDETAEMIDLCRSIGDFIHSQLDDYDTIKEFYHANRANFDSLETADKRKVEQMRLFFEDENPVDDFRIIKKIDKELKTAISEVLESKRAEAESRYRKLFEGLAGLAAANKVPASEYPDKEYLLEKIKKEKDILQLRLRLSDADRFESEQREVILKAAARIKQEEEAKNNPSGNGVPLVADPPVSYRLPKADKILETESDIDEYIGQIRDELTGMIKENKRVIIK